MAVLRCYRVGTKKNVIIPDTEFVVSNAAFDEYFLVLTADTSANPASSAAIGESITVEDD